LISSSGIPRQNQYFGESPAWIPGELDAMG
jgi:hypothetical protein